MNEKKKIIGLVNGGGNDILPCGMWLGGSEGTGSTSDEDASGNGESQTITMLVQQSRNFDGLQEMIKKLEEEENIVIDVQVVPDDESLNMIKMKTKFRRVPGSDRL